MWHRQRARHSASPGGDAETTRDFGGGAPPHPTTRARATSTLLERFMGAEDIRHIVSVVGNQGRVIRGEAYQVPVSSLQTGL